MKKDMQIEDIALELWHKTTIREADMCDDVAEYLYNADYCKISDVAREIFEDIDRMCIDTFGNFNHRVFAELKKKYTESEKDNG